MDLAAYFRRIGYAGGVEPTLDTLRELHRAHAYRVPFENLDIARGREIVVDAAANFEKIVGAGRGGFCLELSGLFAAVLRELGFRVDVLAARTLSAEGVLGRPMNHMTLLVHVDGPGGGPWLADVGFGGRVIEPLRLDDETPRVIDGRRFAVAHDGDHWFVTCAEPATRPATYVFTLAPRAFGEFDDVCRWLQTSPDSQFTRGDFASLATASGRRTYTTGRLIEIEDGERRERAIGSEAEAAAVLRERFGLDPPAR